MDVFHFKKALPIWAEHREKEKNCELAFRMAAAPGKTVLYLAASTLYRLWVNGAFAGAGPARSSHGYYVVDRIDLSEMLTEPDNVIVIEVVGYNVNTYDTLDQPSFLTAELFQNGRLTAYTGGEEINIYDLRQRVQEAERYSFQRGFSESYRLSADKKMFYTKPEWAKTAISAAVQETKRYLKRSVRMPRYEQLSAVALGGGLYEFPFNATGFLRFTVECETDCIIYVSFDEILTDGRVDSARLGCCNRFTYLLDGGHHEIMTFAPYTMKYVQIEMSGGGRVTSMKMVEYKHPPVPFQVNLPEDESLKAIYQAALETYRANAVDIFMDCPSRERAGWLCDSFFTARVEKVLTGESVLEQAFLENFLRGEGFAYLPKGMLPMCYPADHNDGNFIPNWAMWFVLELEEYEKRSKDRALVDWARERVYGLLDYFSAFENEDGLLEKLDKWVFVEWSRANDADVVQDINFPTNMLYLKMLHAVSSLYGDAELSRKAEQLRSVIRSRSRKGVFFTDNEVYTSKGLVNPGNCTEVCQYYAFFCGAATREEDGELWEILCRDFGYQRKDTGLYPEVAFANAFIGNYLRIELLYQDGQYEKVVDNIRGYFTKMAQLTGTLWEHDSTFASCNHGFASHVIYWLAGIYGTSLAGEKREELQNE